jgi:hypothetical protein
MTCAVAASCPAIFLVRKGDNKLEELTPDCALGSCPTVYKDGDKYVIIGKRVTETDYPDLKGRIGESEGAVEIDLDLILKAIEASSPQAPVDLDKGQVPSEPSDTQSGTSER